MPVVVRALLSRIDIRLCFLGYTFPILEFGLDFVCIYNIHALISIMEMVGSSQYTAIVVKVNLGWTLSNTTTLDV